MPKVETTSKVLLELTSRINLGGRGARVKLSILDIVHKPLHSLERVKRLSPRSKCYCFSNVYCFTLERLEFKYPSVFYDPSNLKSISPALPNPALICAALHRKLITLRCVLGGVFSYVFIGC